LISSFLSYFFCITIAIASLGVTAAYCYKNSLLATKSEAWLVSCAVLVVGINIEFALLSLLPFDMPIKSLAIPLHCIVITIAAYFIRPKFITAIFVETYTGALRFFLSLQIGWRLATGIFLCLLFTYGIQGLLTVPSGVDELSYHVPQAVGMFQDGRVRSFNAPPSWVYFYPHGAASVWAWTMLFTGSDALFRLVQFGFSLQLLLATGLLAHRMGASKRPILITLFTVIAMPVFYTLTSTTGGDLGYAAAILSFLAVLAPSGNKKQPHLQQHLLASLVFLGQAVLIKIPVIAVLFFSIAATAFLLQNVGLSNTSAFLSSMAKRSVTWIVLAIFVGCFYVYFLNFRDTGNPMYPLTLRIAGVEVFQGPLRPIEDIVMGHSTFGSVSEMKFNRRWHAVFADWFQPVNQDAFGGAGPIFIIATIFSALLGIWHSLKKHTPWILALTTILLLTVVVPAAHLPRYSLSWLCLIAVFAAITYSYIEITLPSVCTVILLILLPGLNIQVREIENTFNWVTQMSMPQTLLENRGRAIVEKVDIDRTLAPSGDMVRAIRDRVRKDELLTFSVRSHATLMWNREYTNKIEYVKHQDNDVLPPTELSRIFKQTWFESIQKKERKWVLVYAKSGLADTLLDPKTNKIGYQVAFADRLSGNENTDRWNMVLLERSQ
jgi:hypothetical protein